MEITPLLVALLGTPIVGGVIAGVRALFRWWTRGKAGRAASVEHRRIHDEMAVANQSVLVVQQSQAQLVADNQRYREEIAEMATRHATERAQWAADKAEMRQELDQMEERLRAALDKLSTALDEVQELRRRHGMPGSAPAPA